MTLKSDIHTHILHGVDDGAVTIDESLTLIDRLKIHGITNVCLTPHFYTHKESIEDFLERRSAAFEELKPLIPTEINVKLGAEVYVTKYLFSQERDLTPLCIENTPYMITEFSYQSAFSDSTMRMINRIRDFGVIPILPHIERYPALLKNKALIEELTSIGVVIQSNISSYTNSSCKRKLIKLMNAGYIDILSTDVHSLNRNSPDNIPSALEFICKKCGTDVIDLFNKNALAIFEG